MKQTFLRNEQETVVVPESNVDLPEDVLDIINNIAIEHENDPAQLYLNVVSELSGIS